MAMELKQSLKLSQQLVMTPQLQQAIKLLQLSRLELLEQVREEMEQNPLLETPDETVEGDLDEKEPGEASLEAENLEQPQDFTPKPADEKAEEVKGDNNEGANEIDWDQYLNSYQFNEPTLPSNRGNIDSEDLPSFEANLVKKEDLQDHLNEQLAMLKLNDAERRIAMLIVGNLDDDGYLTLDDQEGDPLIHLAVEADVPVSVAERTLRKIQHLEPKGCGSRDLQECLLIQACALKDEHAALLSTIIKRHLKLLESKNLPAIAKDLKVALEDVVKAAKLLPKLDPKPGRNFSGEDAQYITPDVQVTKLGTEYHVVLNDDGLSKLRISAAYRDALKHGQLPSGQTKEFVQEKMRSAMWLIRSIHQRQRTIYKVTESIVKFQRLLRQGHRPLEAAHPPRRGGGHRDARVDRLARDDQQVRAHPAGHLRAEVLLQQLDRPHRRRRHRLGGGEEPHSADLRPGEPQGALFGSEDRRAAQGPGHRDRTPHRGQVPRGAGHSALLEAQALGLTPGEGVSWRSTGDG